MAFRRLAIAYPLRYSHTRGELLSNAFPMAVSDTVRGRRSVVYAVVHGNQLHDYDHCLLLSIPLFPLEEPLLKVGKDSVLRKDWQGVAPEGRPFERLFTDKEGLEEGKITNAILRATTKLRLLRQVRRLCQNAQVVGAADTVWSMVEFYEQGVDFVYIARLHSARHMADLIAGSVQSENGLKEFGKTFCIEESL